MKGIFTIILILAAAPFRAGAQGISFAAPIYYSSGAHNPGYIITSDVDRDGYGDLMAAHGYFFIDTIAVHLNGGDGTFNLHSISTLTGGANSLYAGDIDNDSDDDLAAVGYNCDSVTIFRNSGNGTFQGFGKYSTGDYPSSVVLADFDGDGFRDLAVGSQLDHDVQVRRNMGIGVFFPPTSYYVCTNVMGVNVADVENDGDLDMIFNCTDTDIIVRRNNGYGLFEPIESYYAGHGNCWSACVADFNNDGYPDVATINIGADEIMVLFNNGDGTFQEGVIYGVPVDGPRSITHGDFDRDGDNDLVVACFYDPYIIIMENNSGVFHLSYDIPLIGVSSSLCADDFDGDGDIDLAATINDHDSFAVILNTAEPSAINAEQSGSRVDGICLLGNYPNPFNGSTVIRYRIPKSGAAEIEIFDLLGRKVNTILNTYKQSGLYQVIWDGRGMRSGIYLCRIKVGGRVEIGRMLLLK